MGVTWLIQALRMQKVPPNCVATHWELSGAKPGKVDVVVDKIW